MSKESPYDGVPPAAWKQTTNELTDVFPVARSELVAIVVGCWNDLFLTEIGKRKFRIGVDIFPKPQILGFFLHELIPLELQRRYPGQWRVELSADDKDAVYIPDTRFSLEIKTSSSNGKIFGNRSYAQEGETSKKDKSGYYLAINFEKCTKKAPAPALTSIRFGWLDKSDWIGQAAATGQQARLTPDAEKYKLLLLEG